jgi:hypothetical protein
MSMSGSMKEKRCETSGLSNAINMFEVEAGQRSRILDLGSHRWLCVSWRSETSNRNDNRIEMELCVHERLAG